ncbi:MAG: hypothetical protein FJ241_03825 [Nitrospira sp.]|nr:hypothetical protein [Nitrospira sp.]
MKKVKFTWPHKGFSPPFAAEPDYYKTKTYDEVFNAVREDINNNLYTLTYSAKDLRPLPDNPEHLTNLLKSLVPMCPDLFESDNPSARKLVAHFGKLIWDAQYAQSPKEKKKAKEAIGDILSSKTTDTKWSKIYIPPLLSLNDMLFYLHKITKYLRKQYVETYTTEPLNKNDLKEKAELKRLEETDSRLVEIVEKGYIRMLISKPTELTKQLMADFFDLKIGTLKEYLKKEKKHPGSYTPQKR